MDPNLKLLQAVVEQLGPLTADLVFVGGSVAALLLQRFRTIAHGAS